MIYIETDLFATMNLPEEPRDAHEQQGTQDEPEARDEIDEMELRPGMEPLTPEEKDAFLARARAEGRVLTSDEQYALFGPPPKPVAPTEQPVEVREMQPAHLTAADVARLRENFFPELGDGGELPRFSLVQGIIFDLDYTLATLSRPHADLLVDGAKAAEAYMRSTGMDFPDDFYTNIIEARRFAEEKSEEEAEEHIADDAMSFLLQFFGYPASRMDRDVLRRAVDIFYAPEMTAWQLRPGVKAMLRELQAAGFKLALIGNYNDDRVFQRTVDYLGIRPYMDMVLSSASVEYRKPDVKIFELVLNYWDALPYEVVVVGDSLRHDIQGGIETGALTVLLAQDTHPQVTHDNEQLAGQVEPDATLDDLRSLPDLIRAWATP